MDTKPLSFMSASLRLARPEEPKVFCKATRRSSITGYIAHSCSFHQDHENDHRDVHTGATWSS